MKFNDLYKKHMEPLRESKKVFSMDKVKYDLELLYFNSKSQPLQTFRLSDLEIKCPKNTDFDKVDTRFPILVAINEKGKLIVVDGDEIAQKLLEAGYKVVYGRLCDNEILAQSVKEKK